MKDTGKGRSREEAQQQAAEKVNFPNFILVGLGGIIWGSHKLVSQPPGTPAGCRKGEQLI